MPRLPGLEKIAHEFQNLLSFQRRAGRPVLWGAERRFSCDVTFASKPGCSSLLRCSTDAPTWPSGLSLSTRSVRKSSTSPFHSWRQASALWSPGATGQCLHQPFSVGKTASFTWALIETVITSFLLETYRKCHISASFSPLSARMAYLDKFCLCRRFRKLPIKLLSRR